MTPEQVKRVAEIEARLLDIVEEFMSRLGVWKVSVSEKPLVSDDGARELGSLVTMTCVGVDLAADPAEPQAAPVTNAPASAAPECRPEVCPHGHYGDHDPTCAWKRWKDQNACE